MLPKIQTASGYAIPPAPRHSITVHFPGWENATKIRDRHLHPTLLREFKSMYPRVKIHTDITAVRLHPHLPSC
jgi:cystathionine gamma-synthase